MNGNQITQDLRRASGELRTAPHVSGQDRRLLDAVADLLEEVAGWREEGLGVLPLTNLGDAWVEVEDRAVSIARAFLA